MTVKWLMHWQPKPGTTLSTQILTEACQCVESIGGQKDGRWRSVLTFYKPMQRDALVPVDHPRDFLGLALQEQPAKYYFILRPNRIVLEADASIQVIMEKLQSYKARVTLNFEGFQYKLGDFQLRVGKCVPSASEALRGIMMEVEYIPLSSIDKSRQVLEEFFDIWQETISKKSLPGHFMHIESNFADYGLQDRYTSHHTAVQYATCMAQLIAAVRC
ncbi:mediator of RNA polymerase II transcription subunit 20a [Dendrobium catenatum]|uniref:Mediator of RNA polymerase II transcription subunit 20 n=1 Tax=Dendrobium catenatum TaxID=906689 RepID=A0A2I0W1K6_9ASPA|nr:mediator of RNA polymerase II transcription subunit 20a [Dendrobium catenatum]PKU69535.1 Mediator of RNA polymerase II transcription subunit 20a [Dendrobium catenatum]